MPLVSFRQFNLKVGDEILPFTTLKFDPSLNDNALYAFSNNPVVVETTELGYRLPVGSTWNGNSFDILQENFNILQEKEKRISNNICTNKNLVSFSFLVENQHMSLLYCI
jgi:hypothetical protein